MSKMIDTKNSSIAITPSFTAQKCPVCNGWGTVSFKRVTCHACEGKGYIAVPVEIDRQKEYGRSSK